jgi:hypothetical protein
MRPEAVVAGMAAAAAERKPVHDEEGSCGVRTGLSPPDAEGYRTYTRPEGKSGGHGVGWSEIPRYMGNLLGHQRGHSCGAHPHPVA